MRSPATAYLLWLLCFLGLCGIHRIYAGKPITGIIWFFTFGLLGLGQLIDLFLIPGMIDKTNYKWAALNKPTVVYVDRDVHAQYAQAV